MNRERLASAALRALPAELRASRGEEIVGTLLDASAAGPGRFGREVVGLVRFGLRARAMRTASSGTRRVVADGFCAGAVLVMTLDLSTLLAQKVGRGYADSLLSWTSIGLLGVILATALVGAERLAGIAAVGWTASRMPDLVGHNPTLDGIAPTVVPVVCFAVLILAPRPRAIDVRRLGWLGAVAAVVLAFGPQDGGAFAVIVGGAAIVVVGAAVLRLPTDPHLAIACALPAAYVGLQVAGKPVLPVGLAVVVALLVVAGAVVGLRRLPEPARL